MIFHFVYNACPDIGAMNYRNGPIFSVLTAEFLDILITATNPGLSIYRFLTLPDTRGTSRHFHDIYINFRSMNVYRTLPHMGQSI